MSYSILTALSQLLNPGLNPVEAQMAESKGSIFVACDQRKEQGVVTQTIQPGARGRVRFQATIWFAICPYDMVLPAHTAVRVYGRYNATTLIVEPILQVTSQIAQIENVS